MRNINLELIFNVVGFTNYFYDIKCTIKDRYTHILSYPIYTEIKDADLVEVKCKLPVYEYHHSSDMFKLVTNGEMFKSCEIFGGIVVVKGLRYFDCILKKLPRLPDLYILCITNWRDYGSRRIFSKDCLETCLLKDKKEIRRNNKYFMSVTSVIDESDIVYNALERSVQQEDIATKEALINIIYFILGSDIHFVRNGVYNFYVHLRYFRQRLCDNERSQLLGLEWKRKLEIYKLFYEYEKVTTLESLAPAYKWLRNFNGNKIHLGSFDEYLMWVEYKRRPPTYYEDDVLDYESYGNFFVIQFNGYYFALEHGDTITKCDIILYQTRIFRGGIIIVLNCGDRSAEYLIYFIRSYDEGGVELVHGNGAGIYNGENVFCSKDMRKLRKQMLFA